MLHSPGYINLHFVVKWVQNCVIYFLETEKKVIPDPDSSSKMAKYHKNIIWKNAILVIIHVFVYSELQNKS